MNHDQPYPRINWIEFVGDQMWLATTQGLLQVPPHGGPVASLDASPGPGALSDNRVRIIRPGPGGRWWIGLS